MQTKQENIEISNEEEIDNINDIIPAEILEKIPKEAQGKLISSFELMMEGSASPISPLMKKIQPEHITSFLEGQKEGQMKEYQDRRDNKVFIVVLVALGIAAFITIIVLLRNNAETMEKIIYAVGGLLAGAFGGFGLGKNRSSNE